MQGLDDLWRSAPPPTRQLALCVVVPVRDEAERLWRTLESLECQSMSDGRAMDRRCYEILLLANNCSDGSAELARTFARDHPALALHVAEVTLPPPLANIGHVRRLLMDAAAARLDDAGMAGVIASTDGDTVVASDWLCSTAREIQAGADAVGGRILIEPGDDCTPRLRRWRRSDAAYRLACERLASQLDPDPADPWPRHHQHFCGSLAITRAAYLAVGGLPDVSFLEDEALVSALRRHDLRIRHSPAVRVVTSGRQQGRAEVGLAWQLRQWAEDPATASALLVEDAGTIEARLTARRQLRDVWQRRRSPADGDELLVHRLASRWQMAGSDLASRITAACAFGALWADLECVVEPSPLVPVRMAIDGLRALVRDAAMTPDVAHRTSRAMP